MSNATEQPPNGFRLLFADDEENLQELIGGGLRRMGHEVTVCPDGLTAVAALERNSYDCILVDIDMPGLTGIEVIARCKQMAPDTAAIILTGKATQETAIQALRLGAFDYLTKPCRLADIRGVLEKFARRRELEHRLKAAESRLKTVEGKSQLIGGGAKMQAAQRLIVKVAPTDSTVLILGETGTGKELAAKAVHDFSRRADKPYVTINCGALPENLIESELFGHRKGAFTGAEESRTGLFEVADGGTLFLDEIGELPKTMQAKLLRALESGEIRRVGENDARKVNVRVVCATHRNLEQMVEEGDFREDLLFRINPFEIPLPPLRDRLEDIPALADHLYQRFCPNETKKPFFSGEVTEELKRHVWPGNVRELANVIEHATILSEGPPILPEHLPRRFNLRRLKGGKPGAAGMSLKELEMQAIYDALERYNGSKPKAAEELGVSLKTLYNKLNQATLEGANRAA